MTTLQTTDSGVTYVNTLSDTTPADVPVYNPNALFKEWGYDEIYFGKDKVGEGNKGRYVPNVGDKVFHRPTGTYIVEEVSQLLIPSLVRYREPPIAGATDEDFLMGVGTRFPQPGYFIYVDSSVSPPVLAVDSMAYIRLPSVSYVRVFAGLNPLPNSEVISANYNASGEYVDDKIPCTRLSSPDGVEAYVPQVGWAKRAVVDGEPLTMACYDAKGNNVGTVTWLARNSGMVRQSNAATKSIVSIELVGPTVDVGSKTVKIAVNALLSSLTLMCRVTYRGGKQVDRPIDGVKIRLVSDTDYLPTSPGINQQAILIYNFDSTEAFDGSSQNAVRFFQDVYVIEADAALKAYGMKLFSFPYWKSASAGYGIRHFLQSIDRDIALDVTDKVEVTSTSAVWDPLLFGVKQRMTFALDISKVDARYSDYRHTQSLAFSLLQAGNIDGGNNWLITFENGYADYGDKIVANLAYISSQVWTCGIDCGAATVEEWLERLYYRTRPMYDSSSEGGPLAPTHFVLQIGGLRYRKPISSWNLPFTVQSGGAEGDLAVIHWVQEVNGVDLQLATSGLIIHQSV